jgi:hypothetical protein
MYVPIEIMGVSLADTSIGWGLCSKPDTSIGWGLCSKLGGKKPVGK